MERSFFLDGTSGGFGDHHHGFLLLTPGIVLKQYVGQYKECLPVRPLLALPVPAPRPLFPSLLPVIAMIRSYNSFYNATSAPAPISDPTAGGLGPPSVLKKSRSGTYPLIEEVTYRHAPCEAGEFEHRPLQSSARARHPHKIERDIIATAYDRSDFYGWQDHDGHFILMQDKFPVLFSCPQMLRLCEEMVLAMG